METRLIVRFAVREILGVVLVGVAQFWSAGRINWWPGWALVAMLLLWSTATATVILRSNPALLAVG